MKNKNNTAALWDSLWKSGTGPTPNKQTLELEASSIRWRRMKAVVLKRYGSFHKLHIIELGSGIGTYAALMANEGATVTLVDYSLEALRKAKLFFASLNLKATFVHADLFSLNKEMYNHFDISISCGVAEHFLNEKRTQILKIHFAVLKPAGLTFISVPNHNNVPYRCYKRVAQKWGFWPWGEEYPYTPGELELFCQKNNILDFGFFGDSFIWSLNYVNPFSILSRKFPWFKHLHFPQTIGTPLDSQFGYALGIWAIKPKL